MHLHHLKHTKHPHKCQKKKKFRSTKAFFYHCHSQQETLDRVLFQYEVVRQIEVNVVMRFGITSKLKKRGLVLPYDFAMHFSNLSRCLNVTAITECLDVNMVICAENETLFYCG